MAITPANYNIRPQRRADFPLDVTFKDSTGAAINVPVGAGTLGRIMDVLGDPQDERGPVAAKDHWEIHRAAPSYDEQAGGQDLLETGIKVIDLLVPFAKGGKIGDRKSTRLNSSH